MDKATNRPSPELARVGPDMARLEKKLAELGLHRIVRLDHAQVFVGEVRPAALRAISELPLVGVIRPNRTHRRPTPR